MALRQDYYPHVCSCWVSHRSERERFGIRYGAHSTNCPQYRPSLDPVDKLNDQELRQRNEPARA